jgi:hypothetical protein
MFYFCSTESALNAITSYFIRVVLDRFALGSADRRCQSMKRRQLLKMAAAGAAAAELFGVATQI